MSNIHEECGVFGVYSKNTYDIASTVYYGLFALQHRGQESAGIVVNDDGVFSSYKNVGIVNDVFTKEILCSLSDGHMAVGHVRYGTTGTDGRLNAQPIVVNHIKGRMALAHNGNLSNSFELRNELEMEGSIFHTTSDTEVISYVVTKERISAPSIEEAVNRAMYKLDGAYSLVIMSPSKLIAVRDENGFRPLCYGITEDGDYVFASESCALDAVGAKLIRDVRPGEIIVVDENGLRCIEDHCDKKEQTFCVFEYIYFSRPDSCIEGCSVHEARVKAGKLLAREHPVDADIVIGVPDSGIDAAIGFSRESGIPYSIGLIKNKYIARTFISPGQKSREDRVSIKLNPIIDVVKGKRVVLIDDSIVRGTTSKKIVKLIREAGAKEVHMRVSAPAFIGPCYYGTDIDSKDMLIAANHTIDEIEKMIGVDSLGYISVESVKQLASSGQCGGYCTGCFNDVYPTDIPKTVRKNKFEQKISKKGKR